MGQTLTVEGGELRDRLTDTEQGDNYGGGERWGEGSSKKEKGPPDNSVVTVGGHHKEDKIQLKHRKEMHSPS